MIAEIRFKNLFSFRDETVLSFEADNSTELEEYHVVEVVPGVRLLKMAIIYGANASGKSNVLKAWSFFQGFIKRARFSKSEPIAHFPFMLNNTSVNDPITFGVTFYDKNLIENKYEKYVYDLEIRNNSVEKEELYHYKSAQPTMVFERTLDHGVSVIKFNPKIKMTALTKNEITIKCLPNISVFSAYTQVNAFIPELESPLVYLDIKSNFPIVGSKEFFPEQIDISDEKLKQNILSFLKEADFNISDVERSNEKILDSGLKFTHTVKNDSLTESFTFDDSMESDGTLRIFRLAGYIYEIIANNGFIAIDEIESSLHPKLVEFLVERFIRMSVDQQMLFTTHYDGMLAQEDLIRKDNIWFTAKDTAGVSELYSLTDFTGLNRIASLQRAYRAGKFGAIPNM